LTSSTVVVLVGEQTPRVALVPKAVSRDEAEDAAYLASQYGLTPDDWQRAILDGWLGTKTGGRWAAPRCGLSVSRQNGKNAVLEMRELYGMFMLGERVLHTAHEVKTAQKAFRRLLDFFDNPRQYPKLHARTTMIRKANGQEAIYLDNGGSFELVARSRGSGRGFSCDVLVMDEAQEMTEDALAALLPTISASPNPQQIYTGTPPGPAAQGAIFSRIRSAGLEGHDPRLCWLEWGCDGVVDLDDRSNWATANPAMGIRLDVDTISDERAAMDDETFARERLGVWSTLSVQRVISAESWAVCAQPGLVDGGGEVCFAVDVAPDRGSCSIAAASWTADELPFVDVVETRRGEPDWGIEKIADMCDRHDVRAVVIDAGGPAVSLVDPLRQRGITVTVTTSRQMAAACANLFDLVMDGRVRHLDQPLLNVALSVARRRTIGDSGWGWSRKDSESDITPVTAATLALWGLTSSEVAERLRVRSGHAVFF
jgi:phage terminase large subunit-like protein